MIDGVVIHKRPHVLRETGEFFLNGDEFLGIIDSCFDLGAIADEACVSHELGCFGGGEAGDLVIIKISEGLGEIVTFA